MAAVSVKRSIPLKQSNFFLASLAVSAIKTENLEQLVESPSLAPTTFIVYFSLHLFILQAIYIALYYKI